MNERFENCLYQAGLTAQGCWDELDTYTKDGIEKFAELIVKECSRIAELKEQGYSAYDPDTSSGWYIRQYFGVE